MEGWIQDLQEEVAKCRNWVKIGWCSPKMGWICIIYLSSKGGGHISPHLYLPLIWEADFAIHVWGTSPWVFWTEYPQVSVKFCFILTTTHPMLNHRFRKCSITNGFRNISPVALQKYRLSSYTRFWVIAKIWRGQTMIENQGIATSYQIHHTVAANSIRFSHAGCGLDDMLK